MAKKKIHELEENGLRIRGEARVRSDALNPCPTLSPKQLLHDLQVHQIELEMQNEELRRVQMELEISRERYFDLYDLAPIGYFTLNEQELILEANLTATQLLGVEREALVQQSLTHFILPDDQDIYYKSRKALFKTGKPQVCEVRLREKEGAPIWVCVESTLVQRAGSPPVCRVVMSDICDRKQAESAQRQLDILTASNQKLAQEIAHRREVEEVVRQSEQRKSELLEQSRHMQQQLRHLSRKVLMVQEDERKRISRELHDVIVQALVSINVRLALLKKDGASLHAKDLDLEIENTQQMVAESLNLVHQFARELRPPVLDDLGLIPALNAFTKSFTERTGVPIDLTVFAAVEKLHLAKRTVLYRIAQEALTNVARHAQASRVDVNILKLPRAVCMTISDNGKSFQVGRVLHSKNNKRLGLVGMRERVEMVGGSFAVESTLGIGTTIRAQVPFTVCTRKSTS